jgi:acetyl esterase/lipase
MYESGSCDREKYTIQEHGSITVTERDDRSQLMSVLHLLVRCFRNQINGGQPKHGSGSIILDPPKSKLRRCTLSKRTVCDIHVYDLCLPTKLPEKGRKRIYYFAGGSWQKEPTEQHWSVCSKMAKSMPDTIVSMVSMPVAPTDPAPKSFPLCLKLYRQLMIEAREAGDKVILAGDSSGANVVLCLTLEALREDAESGLDVSAQDTSSAHPIAIMAISPSTDLTRANPDIEKLAKLDPLLSPGVIRQTAAAWTADWDAADRKVSPINADILLLAKRGIRVHGITAGCDVLAPDGVLFRNKLSELGVQGEWLHWEKQMHCFVLTLPYGLREAEEGVQWVIDVLKKE